MSGLNRHRAKVLLPSGTVGSNPTASESLPFERIPGFPNYEVNKAGVVRNITTGRIKRMWIGPKGYPTVSLFNEECERRISVSQIVMHTFSPIVMGRSYVVRYLDGNKLNFSFDNLYYQHCSAMVKNTWARGKYDGRTTGKPFARGEDNPAFIHGRGQLSRKDLSEWKKANGPNRKYGKRRN